MSQGRDVAEFAKNFGFLDSESAPTISQFKRIASWGILPYWDRFPMAELDEPVMRRVAKTL